MAGDFNVLGGNPNLVIGTGTTVSASNTANNAHNIGSVTLTGGTLTSNGVEQRRFGHWLLNGNVTTNASATQSQHRRRACQPARARAPLPSLTARRLSICWCRRSCSMAPHQARRRADVADQPNIAYNGTTTIAAGTLRIDGTHNGAGTYTVIGGATLGGSGTISLARRRDVNVLPTPGIVSPGPGYSNANPANMRQCWHADHQCHRRRRAWPLDMNGILQIDIVSPLQHDVLNIATGVIDIDPNAVIIINGDTDLSQLDLGVLGFENGDRVTLLVGRPDPRQLRQLPGQPKHRHGRGQCFLRQRRRVALPARRARTGKCCRCGCCGRSWPRSSGSAWRGESVLAIDKLLACESACFRPTFCGRKRPLCGPPKIGRLLVSQLPKVKFHSEVGRLPATTEGLFMTIDKTLRVAKGLAQARACSIGPSGLRS